MSSNNSQKTFNSHICWDCWYQTVSGNKVDLSDPQNILRLVHFLKQFHFLYGMVLLLLSFIPSFSTPSTSQHMKRRWYHLRIPTISSNKWSYQQNAITTQNPNIPGYTYWTHNSTTSDSQHSFSHDPSTEAAPPKIEQSVSSVLTLSIYYNWQTYSEI